MGYRRIVSILRFGGLLCLPLVLAIACQAPTAAPPSATAPSPATPPNVYLAGTGAEFPFFLYQRWFADYARQHPNVQIDYQPTGSEAGVQQAIAGTVDFAGSDVAMTDAEMAKVARGIVLLPMTAGSVAVSYNLPGIPSGLKLSRQALADIFLGKIDRWNHPDLKALNPELALPDLPVVVSHRSDGSGTTATFTRHLSAISPTWAKQVGTGLSVSWPVGVGIKSNAGVSAQIQQTEGAIGYVEFAYAKQLNLAIAALENKAGKFVLPAVASASQALQSVALPDDLRAFVPDPEGEGAYPIVTYSWLLAYKRYDDPNKAAALKSFVRWATGEGQSLSEDLGYVPLFPEVAQKTAAAAESIQ